MSELRPGLYKALDDWSRGEPDCIMYGEPILLVSCDTSHSFIYNGDSRKHNAFNVTVVTARGVIRTINVTDDADGGLQFLGPEGIEEP